MRGEPLRAGLCHRLTCRKETGGPLMAFAVRDNRHFCPACGSALFGTNDKDGEVEVRMGVFDEAPSGSLPGYELWTPRREHWPRPVAGAAQHAANRP